MWVRIPAWPVAALVFLSKTLNHNCFVLRMGRKAVGPVCCVMHVKEPRTLIVKEKGACPGVSGFAPWAPSRVDMCVLQIFCIIIINIIKTNPTQEGTLSHSCYHPSQLLTPWSPTIRPWFRKVIYKVLGDKKNKKKIKKVENSSHITIKSLTLTLLTTKAVVGFCWIFIVQ